jgi:hypothetical protein
VEESMNESPAPDSFAQRDEQIFALKQKFFDKLISQLKCLFAIYLLTASIILFFKYIQFIYTDGFLLIILVFLIFCQIALTILFIFDIKPLLQIVIEISFFNSFRDKM